MDVRCHVWGIYDHEHEVIMDCEALKEAATSLATHENLLFRCHLFGYSGIIIKSPEGDFVREKITKNEVIIFKRDIYVYHYLVVSLFFFSSFISMYPK